jgi:hypothetical protein
VRTWLKASASYIQKAALRLTKLVKSYLFSLTKLSSPHVASRRPGQQNELAPTREAGASGEAKAPNVSLIDNVSLLDTDATVATLTEFHEDRATIFRSYGDF